MFKHTQINFKKFKKIIKTPFKNKKFFKNNAFLFLQINNIKLNLNIDINKIKIY